MAAARRVWARQRSSAMRTGARGHEGTSVAKGAGGGSAVGEGVGRGAR